MCIGKVGSESPSSHHFPTRLTSASSPSGTLSYSYDQVGNRLSQVVNGTGTTYSYGNYNQLLSAGNTTYDNNENTVSKTQGSNSWTYTYDYENRLKQVQFYGQTVLTATYDADGRRIQTVTGDTTIYHYLAGSWDPAYMKDLTTGVTTDVVFAGSFRVGKVQSGVNYYYHLDLLGSVRLITQTQNLQTFTAKYLPYGNLYAATGAENFQYTGKQLDVSTGLNYYGFRYLDGQSGRFMSADQAQPNYLNPQSLNRYLYALDNPTRYVDPNGLVSKEAEVTPEERAAIREAIKEMFSGGSTGGHGPDTSTRERDPYRGPSERFVMLKLARLNYAATFIGPTPPILTKLPNIYEEAQQFQSAGQALANAANNAPPAPPGPGGQYYDAFVGLVGLVGVGLEIIGLGLEIIAGMYGLCPRK